MGQFGKLTSIADLPPDAELDALIREGGRSWHGDRPGAAQGQA